MGKLGKTIILMVKASDTIDIVKAKLQDKKGIEPDTVTLAWKGKALLEGFRPLAEFEVDLAEDKTMYAVPVSN